MASHASGRWLLTAALAVVALAVVAGAMWLAQAATIQSLKERLAYYEQPADDAPANEDGADDDGSSTEPTASTSDDGDASGTGNGDQTAGAETVPAFVTSVRTTGGVTYVTLDYIQFLVGDEAAEAAAARGDESPPPNDYYIINDNPKLREYPVQEGITIEVVYAADKTCVPEGLAISLAEWAADITGPMQDYYASTYYMATVTDGTITDLRQQYLP